MSVFLGPIHHIMYEKIKNQEDLTERLLDLAEAKGWCRTLRACLREELGEFDRRPLEEIIDQTNIHGWLNGCVLRAEERLAAAGTELVSADKNRLKDMEELYFQFGRAHGIQSSDAEGAYRELDMFLLDGMPCDGGHYMLPHESEEEVVWQYEGDTHPFSSPIGDIKNPYAVLRKSLLKGMFEGSSLQLAAEGETSFRISAIFI